ncbi:DUF4870 domain-containing protein [Cryobacterium sp. Y11]|jgi:hypothetical protein|uniref:DUF4870 domain-containing protein n=1 Tax=Cryobacterium sp. Y11 TaxID=2045016 RepID=UPI001E6155F7|nr:DUF4870 domain-containing protein [Cryobacterium sp. Y11]
MSENDPRTNPYESTPPQNPYAHNAAQPTMNPADEKMWATLIHVGGILFAFIPALIGYLVLRERGPFIRAHSATALNFQITLAIVYLVGSALTALLIGFIIVPVAWVLSLILSILAALAANRGQGYAYPLTIKFFS